MKLPHNPWRHDPEINHTQLVPVVAISRIHERTSGMQQARLPEEEPYIRFLLKRIAKHGFFHPIQLGKDIEGRPRIVDGEHRLYVAEQLGVDRMPAYYHDPETQDWGKPTAKLPTAFTDKERAKQLEVDRALLKSGCFLRPDVLIKARGYRPPRLGQKAPIERQPWEMTCDEFCHPEDPKPLAGHRLLHAHVADRDVKHLLREGVMGGAWASEHLPDGPGTRLAVSVPEYDDRVRYHPGGGAHIDRDIPPNHIVGVDPSMANSLHPEGPMPLSYYRKHPAADAFHHAFVSDALNAGWSVPDQVRAAHPNAKRQFMPRQSRL